MSKRPAPSMGEPVHEFLQRKINEAKEGTHEVVLGSMEADQESVAFDIREGLELVQGLVNPNACGTARQLESFSNTADPLVCYDDVDKQVNSVPLATLANTFRLECGDCLNETCSMRDPEYPADEVKKRLPVVD